MQNKTRTFKNILVTGGAGFIGSNFIRYLLRQPEFDGRIINMDCLTYAGNLMNLAGLDAEYGPQRYIFEQIDIRDADAVQRCFERYEIDAVAHFAAETHVDRSISGPGQFLQTNINGTFHLLQAALNRCQHGSECHFHHVSTDEVYGSLGNTGSFFEHTPYAPRSPYSASKAASDHLVSAWHHTYGLPVTISNCSNNYGAYQHPEKLIPLMIFNMLEDKPLPVYGNGLNIRDWLYVDDHCSGIWTIMRFGRSGECYNIGGENEWNNITLVRLLCDIVARQQSVPVDHYRQLITFVADRPGHDLRYSINCDKIRRELKWTQSVSFAEGLEKTVAWYLANDAWVTATRNGDFRSWVSTNYAQRQSASAKPTVSTVRKG